MRVADNMTFSQIERGIGKNRSEMSELQNQAATQKRVVKPSDDPVAASRVLFNRSEVAANNQFLKNIDYARSFLDYTDQSLSELTDNLVRAKELALSQANDASANKQSRKVVAAEIGQIYQQMVNVGNRKLGERFVFGGFQTTEAPFNAKGNYLGDKGVMRVPIDKNSKVSLNMPGYEVFLGGDTRKETSVFPLDQNINEKNEQPDSPPTAIRGPASLGSLRVPGEEMQAVHDPDQGVDIFEIVKRLEIALNTGDKFAIQESINPMDEAISQVVLSRSKLGARVTALDHTRDTLMKAQVDAKAVNSQLEDADIFSLVSNINKSENTMKATLSTAGKLVQQSLLDFVR